jgi:hypothetical protein
VGAVKVLITKAQIHCEFPGTVGTATGPASGPVLVVLSGAGNTWSFSFNTDCVPSYPGNTGNGF